MAEAGMKVRMRLAWSCFAASLVAALASAVLMSLQAMSFSISAAFISSVWISMEGGEAHISLGPPVRKSENRRRFEAVVSGYALFGILFFIAGLSLFFA